MKNLRISFCKFVSVITCFAFVSCGKNSVFNESNNSVETRASISKEIINEAKQFCSANNLNTDYFLLVDLGRHSGQKRMFLWDFNSGALDSFMVSHGCGTNPWAKDNSKENPQISNVENSHCSSVGKFRIGERGPSNFGNKIKYVLYGLESSNSNAAKRAIVFHSWEAVTDHETYPIGTAEGWGCPAISINAFNKIDPKLQSTGKSVLLWIIKSDNNQVLLNANANEKHKLTYRKS